MTHISKVSLTYSYTPVKISEKESKYLYNVRSDIIA